MKRISAKKYAGALYEALVGKESREEIDQVLKNFADLLIRKNDLSKLDLVIQEFFKLWNQRKGVVESEVVSARELDEETLEILKSFIKDLSGKAQVNIDNRLDRNVLGGVVIKYQDKIIDGSLRSRIEELRYKLYN